MTDLATRHGADGAPLADDLEFEGALAEDPTDQDGFPAEQDVAADEHADTAPEPDTAYDLAAEPDTAPEPGTASAGDDAATDAGAASPSATPTATILQVADHDLADIEPAVLTTAQFEVAAPTPPLPPEYRWAPPGETPKRKRLGLWIGIPAGAAVVALVAASLVLIAPGTSIAGVPVGFLTPGAAADAVRGQLDRTTVVLAGAGGDVEVTGARLGATVDAAALSKAAFAEHPMWNVAAWFSPPSAAVVTLDPARAEAALQDAVPELYLAPVDAEVTFDAATASYVSSPAVAGEGVDLDALRDALQDALASGASRVEFDATTVPVEASVTTAAADETVAKLNSMLDGIGFYVGQERTVPIDRAVAASWLTVSPADDTGAFRITADEAAIQQVVETLPGLVDRAPVDATVITNSAGSVLREETVGVTGRTLGDTTDVAGDFAAQLGAGNGAFELPVTEAPFATTSLFRKIEVDLGAQRTYLFQNGDVVQSWAISSGKGGTPTHAGSFTIFAHVRMQDMGCVPSVDYCTPDVPWVSYFNGDEAFHGTYWHNNFGTPMSHGCVNMTIPAAEFVYEWAPIGTEVWVH